MQSLNQLKMMELGEDQHVDLEIVFARKKLYDRIDALYNTEQGMSSTYIASTLLVNCKLK